MHMRQLLANHLKLREKALTRILRKIGTPENMLKNWIDPGLYYRLYTAPIVQPENIAMS